jgi:hypothetical protein
LPARSGTPRRQAPSVPAAPVPSVPSGRAPRR